MKKAKRMIVSALTAIALMAQMCPPVSAAAEVTYRSYSWNGSALVSENITTSNYKTLTWGDSELTTGTYVVSDNIVLYDRLNVAKDAVVNLVVLPGNTLTCKEGISCGYDKNNKYGTLNIYGTGKIVTTGKENAAGIGGDNDETNGYITVHGTEIEATGGKHAAGIGGGEGGKDPNENSPTIKIFDGKITATGGIDGAGIGGGDEQPGARTYIYGGDITASSKKHGAGIGGGDEEGTYGVWIYGGKVTATGGDHGAGIGAGEEGGSMRSGDNGGVNILGGNVTAKGGEGAAGIGGGWGENVSGEINISGTATKLNVTGGYNGAGIGSGGCNNSLKKGDMKATITISEGSDSDISIISGAQGAGIGAGEGGNVSGKVFINGGRIKIKGYYGGAGIGGGCEAGQFFVGGEGGTVYIGGGDLTIHVCDYEGKAEAIGSGANDYVSGTVYIAADNNKTRKYMRVSYNKDNGDFFSPPAEPNATAKAGDRTGKCHSNCSLFITECPHTDHNGNSGLTYTIVGDQHQKKCKYCGLNETEAHKGSDCECGYMSGTCTVTLVESGNSYAYVARNQEFELPDYENRALFGNVIPTPFYRVTGWKLSGDTSGKVYEQGENVKITKDMTFTSVKEDLYRINFDTLVNGSFRADLTDDAVYAAAGEVFEFGVDADPGYSVSKVTYKIMDGVDTNYNYVYSDPIEIEPDNGKYQLTLPAFTETSGIKNNMIVISAEFTKDENCVYISEGISNGTVTIDGVDLVNDKTPPTPFPKDETVTLKVQPAEGYVLKKLSCLKANGSEVELTQDPEDETKYTFTMPDESVMVSAKFESIDAVDSSLYGYSLSLDGDIGVNFYMALDEEVAESNTAYMEFTIPNGTDTETQKVYVNKQTADPSQPYAAKTEYNGNTYYVFKCRVSAKDMASTITAQMVDGSGDNKEYTYSVMEYAAFLIQHADKNGDEMAREYARALPLVKAMLNYGAAAQEYFNVGDVLANSGLEEEEKELNVTAENINAPWDKESGLCINESEVTFEGTTLSLKSETTLSLYFTGDLDNASFSCYTEVSENADWMGKKFFTVEKKKSGKYTIVRIRGIAAKYLGNSFTVTWGNPSVTYSPLNYCYEAVNSSTSKAKLKNVCKALYLYWQAAQAYFSGGNN